MESRFKYYYKFTQIIKHTGPLDTSVQHYLNHNSQKITIGNTELNCSITFPGMEHPFQNEFYETLMGRGKEPIDSLFLRIIEKEKDNKGFYFVNYPQESNDTE